MSASRADEISMQVPRSSTESRRARATPDTRATRELQQPNVLLLEPDPQRHAVLSTLLEPHCRVVGVVGMSDIGRLVEWRYDLAIINVRAVGVVTAAALVRQLKIERPRMRMIITTSATDSAPLILTIRLPDVVLQDLPPMSDLLPCIATSVASRRVLWWSREVIRVVEELCRPVAHTLSVGEISRRVGISRSRLTQRFRKEVGLAVHQYLCRVGIRLASLLLRHTDAKLAAIAFHAGFYDASHLSRVFYRYTGSRPGAFRRDERDATLRGGRDNCGRVAEAGRLEASSGRMNRRRRRSTKLQRASEIAARP